MCQFLLYRHKGVIVNSVNSGVTRPNLTKILHNADKFMPFNLLKLELRYCNPFWNGSATKKIGPRKTLILRISLVAMATSLVGSQNDIPG